MRNVHTRGNRSGTRRQACAHVRTVRAYARRRTVSFHDAITRDPAPLFWRRPLRRINYTPVPHALVDAVTHPLHHAPKQTLLQILCPYKRFLTTSPSPGDICEVRQKIEVGRPWIGLCVGLVRYIPLQSMRPYRNISFGRHAIIPQKHTNPEWRYILSIPSRYSVPPNLVIQYPCFVWRLEVPKRVGIPTDPLAIPLACWTM